MDKIENHNWGTIFSDISQREVFHNSHYAEVVTNFNEPGLACAKITSIQTAGIELIQASFATERKLVLVDPENSENVSSSFILDGNVESQFALNNHSVRHWGNTHGFQYTPDFQGKHIILNRKLQAFSLSYNSNYFKSLTQSAGSAYLDHVVDCMERGETLLVPPGQLLLQPRMAELLHAIVQCRFQGLTKYLFIEAKILELFALQMEQLNTNGVAKEFWNPADRERLKAVHDYISQNYLEPLTLTGICIRFGLNEFKLKKGYKHFFGSTVFGHIYKLRMQTARQLLTSGQMNVSEVSFHIGYNTVSSFSAAFKKQFGYLPGTLKLHLNTL
ncbi:helix-turn-helix transcriptional regulator [Larkinella punicea]|uniref:AraC family transcriptional regulator n=1 Tax=Larkinella punicea TaxID=2315727 RepID=A0A368JKK8_9BACT|nr:AraC family transcriptional regulator [Larkinella punicea]RCR68188.1 AraC family transcriptional regulator [Larkinella punicea]